MKKAIIFFILNCIFVGISFASNLADNDTSYIVRYYGECFEVGDSVMTYSGVFKFKKTPSSSDYNVYIITFEPINTSSQSCEISIQGDTMFHTSTDTVIDLQVIGDSMDFYQWYALNPIDQSNIVGLSPDHIKLTVHPKDTAIYVVQTMKEEEDNLVYNGDFSEGNKGFWSDYTFTTEQKVNDNYNYGLGPEGRYAVGNNPFYYHQNFCDYSSSEYGKMLIANGNEGTDKIVYAATFDVEPNQNYIVTFEASTISECNSSELPQLQFSISGTKLGNVFKTNATECKWDKYYKIWNSGENTTAKVTILNQNTQKSGNDFAIDNITFRKMCTSYDTIVIINNKVLYDTIEATICDNESYNFNNKILTEEGTYTDHLFNDIGLDSLVTLILHVNPSYIVNLDTTICQKNYIEFNDQQIYEQGLYTAEFKTENGCDSIINMQLNVISTVESTITDSIDSWQNYFFDGELLSQSGVYTSQLESVDGCDSIITLYLTVNDKVYITDSVCQGETYTFGESTLNMTGVYTDSLKAANGNDSVVILSLAVYPNYNDTIVATIEEGTVYNRQGFFASESGTYSHENTSINGCDSTLVLILTVIKNAEIWVPNAFTPDEDYNRTFYIYSPDEDIVIESFRIYNRWGTLLFETSDIAIGWDGKYKGEFCQQGVYIYDVIYRLKSIKGKSFRKTGELLLVN